MLLGRTPEPGIEAAALAAVSDSGLKRALLDAALASGRKPTPSEIDRECRAVLADREIRANLARLKLAGAQLEYRSCDVRDTESFGGLIDSLYAQYGRIDAVIHGAGVIEDRRIADKTADSFDRVFDTKVDSAFVLAQKLRHQDLKLLIFFTSVAGRFGNIGQGDYGAANETLNRLAWQLHRSWPGVRVVSINWGPWLAGMATESVRAGFRKLGLEPISIEAGRRFFAEELAHGANDAVELVAGAGPWHGTSAIAPAPSESISSTKSETQHGGLALIRRSPRIGIGGAMTLEHRLNVKDDPYLLDHLIDGEAVLPAAAAMEYIAQFVAAGWPDWQVAELRDVQALAAVSPGNNGGCDVILRARASTHSEPGQQAVTVELFDPQRKLVCYRATVLLMPQLSEAPRLQVQALREAAPLDLRRIQADVLRGVRFQRVSGSPSMSADGIEADVLPSSPQAFIGEQATGASWLFDPGLLDIAAQFAGAWAHAAGAQTTLPVRFGRVVRYSGAVLKGALTLSFRLKSEPNQQTLIYDAFYADRKGQVRLAILDCECPLSTTLAQFGNL